MLSVIPEDRSKDAWIVAKLDAGVGSIRTHPSIPPRIGPRRRRQGRRSDPKTLDVSKQTANWGRSVGPYKASMKKWGLADSECEQNRQLTTSSTAAQYIDHHPNLASSKPLAIAWLQQAQLTI